MNGTVRSCGLFNFLQLTDGFPITETDEVLLQTSARITNIAPDIHIGHIVTMSANPQKQSIIQNGNSNILTDDMKVKGDFLEIGFNIQ